MNKKYSTLLGVVAVVTSATLFGFSYTLGDFVSTSGMSKTCNELWTALIIITFAVTYSLARKRNPFRNLKNKQLASCTICGICCWCSNVLFLVAYQYISVSETTLLHFFHPTIVAVFMTVAFKERFSMYKLIAILCSIGSLLLMTDGGLESSSFLGIIAALATGAFYCVYPIMLEVSSLKEVSGETIILYMNIVRAVMATVVSLATGSFMLPISTTVFAINLTQASIGFFAYLLTGFSVRILGATNTSFGAMLEPIVSCIIAVFVLNEVMSTNMIYAGILVLLSMFFCSLNNSSKALWPRKNMSFTDKDA